MSIATDESVVLAARSAAQSGPPKPYRHEAALFGISFAISALVWLIFTLGTFGMVLFYVLIGFLIYLFAHSGFIAMLRGNATRITPVQFPDLHQRFLRCCERLGVKDPPEAYVLHADGAFNALATRFLGRNFVVLFSSVVDAVEDRPEALDFYIGHELGHISRKHLAWGPFLWPSSILPLLGAAYSRSREYTCDRYGLACSDSPETAARGMAALAAGSMRWRTMNLQEYAGQARESGGFWMSFHELTSTYPWLSKRMARILAGEGDPRFPSRSPLAWFLALFVPRLGMAGSMGSMIVLVAIIGILAAIAIPAYQDYLNRAKMSEVVAEGQRGANLVSEYFARHNSLPSDLGQAGATLSSPHGGIREAHLDARSGVITLELAPPAVPEGRIRFVPSLNAEKRIVWRCTGETIAPKYLPARCR